MFFNMSATLVLEPAIRVEKLSKSFLKVRGLFEVLLSFPLIARIVSKVPFLRRFLERDVVFKDISFSVSVGELFGIFGANGNGKSTLAYCLADLITAESGKIYLHGEDSSLLDAKANCLIKCGRNNLYGAFTAIENIRFLAGCYSIDVPHAEEVAVKLLSYLGISEGEARKKYVSRLSVGNHGKVALVASLLPILVRDRASGMKPILVLDEPTLGFDAVSVERFFAAISKLRELIPELTILLSTNDPREAAFCDNYRAILGQSLIGDPRKLEALRESTRASKRALAIFADIQGFAEHQELKRQGKIDVEPGPRAGAFSHFKAFFNRGVCDRRRFPFLSTMLVLSIVIPNLVGLFASTPSRGIGPALMMTIFGVAVNLFVREFGRWHSREINYFKMIELTMGFPIPQLRHCAILTLISWWNLFRQIAGVSIVLLILLWDRVAADLFATMQRIGFNEGLGILCVVLGMMFGLQAIGLMIGLVPVITRGEQTIFLVTILPGLVIISGGIFYPIEVLPPIMQGLSHMNPVTYGSVAISEFLDLNAGSELVLARTCCDAIPGLSYAWSNVLVLTVISTAYYFVGLFVFMRMETMLRSIGRFRSQR